MIVFKSCPRCHGDLLASNGEFTCLQCGRDLSDAEARVLTSRIEARRKQPALAA